MIHWPWLVAGVHLLCFGLTMLFYRLNIGAPNDYEELCTMVGASVLWFITWPYSTTLVVSDWFYQRKVAKRLQARALRESINDFGVDQNNGVLANELNRQYNITCTIEWHGDKDDCTHKRRQRIAVLEKLEDKPWVEPSASDRTKSK